MSLQRQIVTHFTFTSIATVTRTQTYKVFTGDAMFAAKMSSRTGASSLLKKMRAFLLLVLLIPAHVLAGQATLAWDPSPDPNAAGYMLHYGQASGTYTAAVDAGAQSTYTVTGLAEGATYYYAVTAYDASRTESALSNQVSAVIPFSTPSANFSASKTAGTAPVSITFNSTSTGTITSYAWNFGDGATGNAANATHSYTAPGVYSVSLTVSGPGGSNAITKSGYITVTAAPAPPVASLSADKTSGILPLTVNFLGAASTGTITSYAWNFGDGSPMSAVQSPAHSYTAAGVYSVALTVSGPNGSNTQTKAGYITVYAPAVASFTAGVRSGSAPLLVSFSSAASTGTINAFAWDFGDGATSNLANPSHSYSAPGTYSVSLTVTGAGNAKNTQTRTNYVTVSSAAVPPVASFASDRISGSAPLAVNFTSTSTGSISTYAWSFGDGTTSNAPNPSHTYAGPGNYSISLTVTGSSGTHTLNKPNYINVSAAPPSPLPPVAAFSADNTSGESPLPVTFTSTTAGTVTGYAWNFGDGTTSSAQNPVHTYANPGLYTVSLTASGPAGSNTLNKANYIIVSAPVVTEAPVANFTSNLTAGAAPLPVQFTSVSTGAISAFYWDFGDGATSTDENPVHSYSVPGTYSVTLSVSGLGISNSQTKSDYLTVAQPVPMPQSAAQPSQAPSAGNGSGGGGCAIGNPAQVDPILPLMLLGAGFWAGARRRLST